MKKIKNKEKRKNWIGLTIFLPILFSILLCVSGCAYSFKGGSVPPHLKTIAIPIVEDQSGYGDPTLRELFTRKLVESFANDNTLQLTDRNTADSMLEGVIVDVPDVPEVITGNEQVKLRKITVTVRMTFQDMKLRKKMWEKSFSAWGNYPSSGGLTQRNEGIQIAVDKLTEDILNDTVAGW
jgi:hypothetical protein